VSYEVGSTLRQEGVEGFERRAYANVTVGLFLVGESRAVVSESFRIVEDRPFERAD
jgi:hypothetical protein